MTLATVNLCHGNIFLLSSTYSSWSFNLLLLFGLCFLASFVWFCFGQAWLMMPAKRMWHSNLFPKTHRLCLCVESAREMSKMQPRQVQSLAGQRVTGRNIVQHKWPKPAANCQSRSSQLSWASAASCQKCSLLIDMARWLLPVGCWLLPVAVAAISGLNKLHNNLICPAVFATVHYTAGNSRCRP